MCQSRHSPTERYSQADRARLLFFLFLFLFLFGFLFHLFLSNFGRILCVIKASLKVSTILLLLSFSFATLVMGGCFSLFLKLLHIFPGFEPHLQWRCQGLQIWSWGGIRNRIGRIQATGSFSSLPQLVHSPHSPITERFTCLCCFITFTFFLLRRCLPPLGVLLGKFCKTDRDLWVFFPLMFFSACLHKGGASRHFVL